MQRFWDWIVRTDDSVGEVTLDAGIAIALAAIVTGILRSFVDIM